MPKIPRQYQKTAIDRGVQSNLLISDQMGLGKSLPAIEIAKYVFSLCNAPCLVISPKGIKLQWEQFLRDQDSEARIWIVDQPRLCFDDFDYVVAHYETVVLHNERFKNQLWSTIILDEAHRIKQRTTQKRLIETKKGKRIHITKAIKNLNGFRRIALTGTPYERVDELWSILNWIAPNKFSSYWDFVNEHLEWSTDFWGSRSNWRIKDRAAFIEAVRPYMIRRTKAMVMPELPPLQTTVVSIELSTQQRKAYETIRKAKDLEAEFAELEEPMLIRNALSRLSKLLQCASDPAGLNLSAPSAKLEWLKEWIEDHPLEPVLIFSRYRKTAERAAQLIDADALIMGGSKPTKLLNEARRIVATIAAAGEGFDLGHISTAVFLDCEWSSMLMQQATERIDRGGNTEPKNIIILQAIDTVDQLVSDALEFKWNQKQLIDQFLQSEQQHEISSIIR